MEKVITHLIISFFIFAISIFLHKHTFKRNVYDGEFNKFGKLKFPVWLGIVFFIVSFIPLLNYAYFIVGGVMYIVIMFNDEWRFSFNDIEGQEWTQGDETIFDKIKKLFTLDLNHKVKKNEETDDVNDNNK